MLASAGGVDVERRIFRVRAGPALAFTALGFGGAPLGNMHRVLAEADADAVIEAAWVEGLRYFDTAPLYGHGLSERRIGRGLRGRRRDDFLVSTKVGRLLEPCAPGEEDAGIYKGVPQVRARYDYTYDGVMRSFEASLSRLGLDRVDIAYVHDIDARNHGGQAGLDARLRELIDRGGWRALAELRDADAVTAIGAGVNETAPCLRLLDLADPDLFLLAGRYTLLEQGPLDDLFPACARRGVGVVIGGPFNSGILARGPGAGAYDYGAAPPEIAARVQALDTVCRAHGVPLPGAALQFVAAHPVVVSVIPGAQDVSELVANIGALAAKAPAAFWDDLRGQGLIRSDAPIPRATAPC